jgi:hypothetical protein
MNISGSSANFNGLLSLNANNGAVRLQAQESYSNGYNFQGSGFLAGDHSKIASSRAGLAYSATNFEGITASGVIAYKQTSRSPNGLPDLGVPNNAALAAARLR